MQYVIMAIVVVAIALGLGMFFERRKLKVLKRKINHLL